MIMMQSLQRCEMTRNTIDLKPYAPKKNLSIPNLISLIRLAMIPLS